jgi:hypothetical protein
MPFVTVIGGMIALPVAALAGGGMLRWQKKRGTALRQRAWIIAGLAAGLLVSNFVGTNDSDWARMVTAPPGSRSLAPWEPRSLRGFGGGIDDLRDGAGNLGSARDSYQVAWRPTYLVIPAKAGIQEHRPVKRHRNSGKFSDHGLTFGRLRLPPSRE